jgi:hypothetical protein
MNATKEQDIEIAKTIADQIGNRAFVMMGTRHKLAGENFLSFDIRGCPAFNKIQITLDPLDTYKVEFFKFRNWERVSYLEREGIYADGLHQCIEANTGLCLSL